MPEGEWDKAMRQRALDRAQLVHHLTCPHCGAMNRPGCDIIELSEQGEADCLVCAYHFRVLDPRREGM